MIEAWRPFGYYLPVADISVDSLAPREAVLAGYSRVILQPFRTRYYFDDGISPHALGYMSLIQPDEVITTNASAIGSTSVSGGMDWNIMPKNTWQEERGGALYVVDTNGNIVTQLAAKDPWRAVEPNLPDRMPGFPSEEVRLEFLRGLVATGQEADAKEYFERMPAQIRTPFQERVAREFGWGSRREQ